MASERYYPYTDYEACCKEIGYPPYMCELFPSTFIPIWYEVMDSLERDYCIRTTSITLALKGICPRESSLLDHTAAAYKIRSYLYSLLNDPVKRSRVTPSLVLDLLHNPEDV